MDFITFLLLAIIVIPFIVAVLEVLAKYLTYGD